MMRSTLLALLLLFGACSGDGARVDAGVPDGRPDLAPDPADLSGDATDAAVDAVDALAPDVKSCAPAAPTANLQLFTKLKADLAALTDPAARMARIDQLMADLAASGGYPPRDASTVVLLHRGSPGGQLWVAGTFNNWSVSADSMQVFADTDLYYLEKQLGSARQEYKLVSTTAGWFRDPLSPHVTWDGIPKEGLGDFNSVVPPWGAPDPNGRIEWLAVKSPQLSNTRDVFVYLPAGYDEDSCSRFPVLLVNDGNESLTRSHFDKVARDTFVAKLARPTILVFVALASQADRMSEYSCSTADNGPKYADFLCDTLVPLVDQRYRTLAAAGSRGIIGASMGRAPSFRAHHRSVAGQPHAARSCRGHEERHHVWKCWSMSTSTRRIRRSAQARSAIAKA